MSYRRYGRLGLLLVSAVISACGQTAEEGSAGAGDLSGAAAGRHVILVTVDTLRADRLGIHGHTVEGASPSPHIDALMASGTHFSTTIAPRAITWPSLASVLTGLYPSGHGAFENGYELADDIPTLATLLARRVQSSSGPISSALTRRTTTAETAPPDDSTRATRDPWHRRRGG